MQPYAGEYGISKNPESFTTYGYSQYFSDKNNNAVLELTRGGITEISSFGMKNFFRTSLQTIDNSISQGYVIGGFDIHNKQYVTSLQDNPVSNLTGRYYTLSYDSKYNGWVSFFDYEPDQMFSLRNEFYSVKSLLGSEAFATTTGNTTTPQPQSTFQILPGSITGNIVNGSTVTACLSTPCPDPLTYIGNVVSFNPITNTLVLSQATNFSADVKMFFGSLTGLYKHYSTAVPRSSFYGTAYRSTISFVVNENPVKSKSFLAISYEGSSGWNVNLKKGVNSDPTGNNFSTLAQDWTETRDSSYGVESYYEGRYAIIDSRATSAAASVTTSVVIRNISGTYGAGGNSNVIIPAGAQVSGYGVDLGTKVVSYTPATGVLVVNQDLNISINTLLYFNLNVDWQDYQTVFGTSQPNFINQFYKGFNRKENKYVASLNNNSGANAGEVNFGDDIAGIKGFYMNVTMSTDAATDPGGEKQLFSVNTTYNMNNGY